MPEATRRVTQIIQHYFPIVFKLILPGIRHLGHPRHPVPADPEDAPRRQTGRNLEATGLSSLHSQTGKIDVHLAKN